MLPRVFYVLLHMFVNFYLDSVRGKSSAMHDVLSKTMQNSGLSRGFVDHVAATGDSKGLAMKGMRMLSGVDNVNRDIPEACRYLLKALNFQLDTYFKKSKGKRNHKKQKSDWLEITVVVNSIFGSVMRDNYVAFPQTIVAIREGMERLLKINPKTKEQWMCFMSATRIVMRFASGDGSCARRVMKRLVAVHDRAPADHRKEVDTMLTAYKVYVVDGQTERINAQKNLTPEQILLQDLKRKLDAEEPPPQNADSSWECHVRDDDDKLARMSRQAPPYMCAMCEKVEDLTQTSPLAKCSRCQSVRYCNAKCQKRHWRKKHKLECKELAEQRKLRASGNAGARSSVRKSDNDDDGDGGNTKSRLTREQLKSMPVRELKIAAKAYKVDISNVIEKSDLVRLIANAMGV